MCIKGGNGWGYYEHCSSSDRVTVTGVWVGIVNVERWVIKIFAFMCVRLDVMNHFTQFRKGTSIRPSVKVPLR